MSSACEVAIAKPRNEIGDKRMLGMMQNGSENRGVVGSPNLRTPRIEIVEQPASKALRFRYECEGRSAGSTPGVHSTPENKTYPTIRIVGYTGNDDIVVIVSCVTKDAPYRAHPHNLVGRECKDGICTIYIDKETMTASFTNLGIQCVKKKEIESALRLREQKKVDPFKQGFDHIAHPSSIDLNSVRLCFQAVVKGQNTRLLAPAVVSDPIYDKKAMSDLIIIKLSQSSAAVKGGSEIILLCEKVAKEDIKIRFYEESEGHQIWESFGDILLVHKQVSIAFKTPSYRTLEVDRTVEAFIQLYRPSDKATSDPLPFKFTPTEPGYPRRKTPKLYEELWHLEQKNAQNKVLFENNSHATPFPIKSEPCSSPDFVNQRSPIAPVSRTVSPYNECPVQNTFTMVPTTIYNPIPAPAQLPPFGDLPKSAIPGSGMMFMKQEYINKDLYVGGSVIQSDFPINLGNELAQLAAPATNQNTLFPNTLEADQTNLEVFNEHPMSFNNFDMPGNHMASVEMRIDSNDLLNPDVQQNMAVELSQSLSQSLNISEDGLTRLTNEVYEKQFNQN